MELWRWIISPKKRCSDGKHGFNELNFWGGLEVKKPSTVSRNLTHVLTKNATNRIAEGNCAF
ncbi:MAG: hypothetical protein RSC87_09810, partial [Muribaculaceae bacterium]